MNVLGLGDNVVDKYVYKSMMYPGGNAVNFSVYAKQLGAQAAYLGIFGTDEEGRHVHRVLNELGVDTSRSRSAEGENGCSLIELIDGDRVMVGWNKGGVQQEHPLVFDDSDYAYMKQFQWIHTSIYSGIESQLPELRALGVPLSFDCSDEWDDDDLKRVCPHVDLCLLSCGTMEEDAVREKLAFVASEYGCTGVLGTMGSRGALLYYNGAFHLQKPHFVQPVDTLGAGDSFFTAFVLALLTEGEWNKASEASVWKALGAGAAFAAKTCLVEGAFGYGKPY